MTENKAVAIVAIGAILPDADNTKIFWENLRKGKYSITDTPADRWDADLYYDPDPKALDKSYTKVGGWIRDFKFDPFKMKIMIPPNVSKRMDRIQQYALVAANEVLQDYGYPEKEIPNERTAVIIGNAMGGEEHLRTSMRIRSPEFVKMVGEIPEFNSLPAAIQEKILSQFDAKIKQYAPDINEDSMPGELANIISGRIANIFNFSGPNFVTDAACASSFAALQSAVNGLLAKQFDTVITGGVDSNMGVESFVKFCKIGALSPDGSRPFADGANGFVMAEGAALVMLKRLEDAERDNDRIYAVIRGVGSSSDGKGKGITAPNPEKQAVCINRAWQDAGFSPETASYIEAHGTSTIVGDYNEAICLKNVFNQFDLPIGSIALGSAKSNIGHSKSAAGAVGLIKTLLSLYHSEYIPSANFERPNPTIEFGKMPLRVNTDLRDWRTPRVGIRRAGVSSFGFGGTNFHVVLEEYKPGLLDQSKTQFSIPAAVTETRTTSMEVPVNSLFGKSFHFIGAESEQELKSRLEQDMQAAQNGTLQFYENPPQAELSKAYRLSITCDSMDDFLSKAKKAMGAFESSKDNIWQMLAGRGIFRNYGPAGKIAFLFPGQGSQYANMLRDLNNLHPVIRETFAEADRVMTPILGKPLTEYFLVDGDEEAIKQANESLKDTRITQPTVLTINVAMMRLLRSLGIDADMVAGHSLGEYAALVAAEVLSFPEALEIVSARGREMSKIEVDDNGVMAAVSAPIKVVEETLEKIPGYVVIANNNSPLQSVIGGATKSVEQAVQTFKDAGYQAVVIPVSHAFHTEIVEPAIGPLTAEVGRKNIQSPRIPIIANVTADFYPQTRDEIVSILGQQVTNSVEFIRSMEKMYAEGVRTFIEVGPKRVLSSLTNDILSDKRDIHIYSTNHPRKGDLASLKEALSGLFAAGVPWQFGKKVEEKSAPVQAEVISSPAFHPHPVENGEVQKQGSVVISGAGLGLPGKNRHVFAEDNIEKILSGDNLIDELPDETREKILEKRVTRLIKSSAGAEMKIIEDLDQTLKLAGQSGKFDLAEEFGVPSDRIEALDISTQLAIAAGIDALRDANIPLVMRHRKTSKGTFLPDRWTLPDCMADDTGVVFASAFPGVDRMAEAAKQTYTYLNLKSQLDLVKGMLDSTNDKNSDLYKQLQEKALKLESTINEIDYKFDRRFIFRILSMGHSQFAEYIGARGPNTSVNAACATTTMAVGLAEDWIRSGRCRRVIVISGDDVTTENLGQWIGTGLLATGATTIEGSISKAVLPFDRRRNGLIMGMGAAAIVMESQDAVEERGVTGICEVLSTQYANSAFHGTRLDVNHICQVMDQLVSRAERQFHLKREDMAQNMVFISHETYTPARGGSAAAEINSLRSTFGDQANKVIIANTKGYTGHAMGVGIEDVLAVKTLETGIVPPIANINDGFEPDPDLGDLNLSRGGKHPVEYVLRLGAGFGSQIAMTLMRKIPAAAGRVNQQVFNKWLSKAAGYSNPEIEVVQHTLRVKNEGPPTVEPAKLDWQFGFGPSKWADTNEKPMPAVEPVMTQSVVQNQVQTAGVDADAVKDKVLELLSAKTGYPVDMLDPELDLEADLGIDTVKQAELFAEVREAYGIARRDDLRLTDYNTIEKVIGFVIDNSGGSTQPAPKQETKPAEEVQQTVTKVLTTDAGPVQEVVLAMVSEKTGYPVEMLDPELDLEADLGIDTVKQAELFAEVREKYGIPRRDDLRLTDYNTLEKVVEFVLTSTGSTAVVDSPGIEVKSTPVMAAAQPNEDIKDAVLKIVSEKTGYPVEMLDLDLDLEADLGIDTVKQAELFAEVRSLYDIPRREDLRLSDYNTLQKVIGFVETSKPSSTVETSVEEPKQVEQGPVDTSELAEIEEKVLQLVSQKTGYPVEMLDLELDLEADLGIDTVKQAELFAEVRETYSIPRREDLRLSDYNTLEKVIGFVVEAKDQQEAAAVDEQQSDELVEDLKSDSVVIKRQVPVPVLRPALELCKPTRVEIAEGKRFVIVSDEFGTAGLLSRRLKSRKADVLMLKENSSEKMIEKITQWKGDQKVDGVYFLPGLNDISELENLEAEEWKNYLETSLMRLYHVMKAVGGQMVPLVSAVRMGGQFGYLTEKEGNYLGGAISGFTKAYAMENRGTLVKCVDFEIDRESKEIASLLMDETLSDPGVTEIGYEGDLRFTIGLQEVPHNDVEQELGEKVYLVTGGAGEITAEILADLAGKAKGIFYLLGRTQLPETALPEVEKVRKDRNALKQELILKAKESGQKVVPVEIEKQLVKFERYAVIEDTVKRLEQLGSKAVYLSCDASDADALVKTMKSIQKDEGRIDVIIHGAGVERSKMLPEKEEDEFRLIVSVKADGFFNLYKAMHTLKIKPEAFLSFTSVAGRLGNAGQTDYSAANDLLCKLSTSLNRRFKETRFTAVDWGAWADVGMASRGSLPELMKRAGIDLMPAKEAAVMVRQELLSEPHFGEVMISGELGMLAKPKDRSMGIDLKKLNEAFAKDEPHVLLSDISGVDAQRGLIIKAELAPEEQPFLKDHSLDGVPLLPGVMGIEGFSVAASHVANLFSSDNKLEAGSVRNINFSTPFKFYRNEPREVIWYVQIIKQGKGLTALTELESTIHVKVDGHEKKRTHFCAEVQLVDREVKRSEKLQTVSMKKNGSYPVLTEEIYDLYFHGPSFQVLEGLKKQENLIIGKLREEKLPISSTNHPMLYSPLLLELCLQTAGLWEVGKTGELRLPYLIDEVLFHGEYDGTSKVFAQVEPLGPSKDFGYQFNARVVDEKGRILIEMKNCCSSQSLYAFEDDKLKGVRKIVKD